MVVPDISGFQLLAQDQFVKGFQGVRRVVGPAAEPRDAHFEAEAGEPVALARVRDVVGEPVREALRDDAHMHAAPGRMSACHGAYTGAVLPGPADTVRV